MKKAALLLVLLWQAPAATAADDFSTCTSPGSCEGTGKDEDPSILIQTRVRMSNEPPTLKGDEAEAVDTTKTGSGSLLTTAEAVDTTKTGSGSLLTSAEPNCFDTNNKMYSPVDMAGQGRTQEAASTPQACQQRCASVSGCAHFSYWPDGGCHLQDSSATKVEGSWGVSATGPPTCLGTAAPTPAPQPGTPAPEPITTTAPEPKPEDNYHKECWNSGGCTDDGKGVCAWCGTHNGKSMYCCRDDWSYSAGHNCNGASMNTGMAKHHCATKGAAPEPEPQPAPEPITTTAPEPEPEPTTTKAPEPQPEPATTKAPEPEPEPAPGPITTTAPQPEPEPAPPTTKAPQPAPQPAPPPTTKAPADPNCVDTNDKVYSPADMTGQGRSVAITPEECQQRCASVSGCAHFSYWPDGGCHLQDSSATKGAATGVTAIGPPTGSICKTAPGPGFQSFRAPSWATSVGPIQGNLVVDDSYLAEIWTDGNLQQATAESWLTDGNLSTFVKSRGGNWKFFLNDKHYIKGIKVTMGTTAEDQDKKKTEAISPQVSVFINNNLCAGYWDVKGRHRRRQNTHWRKTPGKNFDKLSREIKARTREDGSVITLKKGETTSILCEGVGTMVEFFTYQTDTTYIAEVEIMGQKKPLAAAHSGGSPRFLDKAFTCSGQPAKTTESMTLDDYDRVTSAVQTLYNKLPTDCKSGYCPQADFAGCIIRMAGHDFMDFKQGSGGSNGCVDLAHPDNKGLEDCLSSQEHGVSLQEAYGQFCTQISLADFLVISAEALIAISRQHVVDQDPNATMIDFRKYFRYGRTTDSECTDSGSNLPDPERGCAANKETFLDAMGLNWKETTALMGVHSIGRASVKNSGYDGWWSDPQNSRLFNNNYYVSLVAKGWLPKHGVDGNPNKNQWVNAMWTNHNDEEMMLDTDMCLMWRGAAAETQQMCCAWIMDTKGKSFPKGYYTKHTHCGRKPPFWFKDKDWQGRSLNRCPEVQLEKCCSGGSNHESHLFGSKRWTWHANGMHPTMGAHWANSGSTGMGVIHFLDCFGRTKPDGPGYPYIEMFMVDEKFWLDTFVVAWQKATGNGFSNLKCVAGAGDCTAIQPDEDYTGNGYIPRGYTASGFNYRRRRGTTNYQDSGPDPQKLAYNLRRHPGLYRDTSIGDQNLHRFKIGAYVDNKVPAGPRQAIPVTTTTTTTTADPNAPTRPPPPWGNPTSPHRRRRRNRRRRRRWERR